MTAQNEESGFGRVTDTFNPWCCRPTRAEASFQLQRLAAIPVQSIHMRAALLLRLNERLEVRSSFKHLAFIELGYRSNQDGGGDGGR